MSRHIGKTKYIKKDEMRDLLERHPDAKDDVQALVVGDIGSSIATLGESITKLGREIQKKNNPWVSGERVGNLLLTIKGELGSLKAVVEGDEETLIELFDLFQMSRM